MRQAVLTVAAGLAALLVGSAGWGHPRLSGEPACVDPGLHKTANPNQGHVKYCAIVRDGNKWDFYGTEPGLSQQIIRGREKLTAGSAASDNRSYLCRDHWQDPEKGANLSFFSATSKPRNLPDGEPDPNVRLHANSHCGVGAYPASRHFTVPSSCNSWDKDSETGKDKWCNEWKSGSSYLRVTDSSGNTTDPPDPPADPPPDPPDDPPETPVVRTPPPMPTVSVASGSAVPEGEDATFTVRASPSSTSMLTVKLSVSQNGDFVASGSLGSKTVRLLGALATYSVSTVNDPADEPDGTVTVTVQGGTGYTVGSTSSATVRISDDDDSSGGGGGGPDPETETPDGEFVAPFWFGPGGFAVRAADGRSVTVTCGRSTVEYAAARGGLVTRFVGFRCRSGGFRIEGAEPGGWYWQNNERNAAVAPLLPLAALTDDLDDPVVIPGGVETSASETGTRLYHETSRLVGIVPHLADNVCSEYVAPCWRGHGGLVARARPGRSTVRIQIECGRTRSWEHPSAADDGIVTTLIEQSSCFDADRNPKLGQLTVTGAEPGGWYWISGDRNAAVSPLVCADLLGGSRATNPGGVVVRRDSQCSHFEHEANRLIGVVPHLAVGEEP